MDLAFSHSRNTFWSLGTNRFKIAPFPSNWFFIDPFKPVLQGQSQFIRIG